MDLHKFWRDVLKQDADTLRGYFDENAYVNWHCTNEHFNVDEFIAADCEYPGDWDGEVERIERSGDLFITVTHVYPKDKTLSFHVTSFIRIIAERITAVDEYWAQDGDAPRWRQNKHMGKPIKQRW